MKRKLFYALVAISSYSTGILVYLGYLSLVYDQGIGSEWIKLLGWTLPPYVFVILPCYTLMFRWRRASFWLRTSLLIVASLIAATSVPFMMGFGIWRLRDLVSPELGLFILFFAGSALVFSFGSRVASQGHGYKVFIPGSIVIILLAVSMLASETEKSRPMLHRIPQDFHGAVEIYFGDPDYPPIPWEKGYEVIRIPKSGIYKTSSERPMRGIRHILVDQQGTDLREIHIPGESGRNGPHPGIMISGYEVP
jgi:hypothetical protein